MITNLDLSSYEKYQSFLSQMANERNQKFNENIIPNEKYILGIPVPLLRKIAKDISKLNYEKVFQFSMKYHEEKLIRGFIIGYVKEDFSKILSRLHDFSFYMDNWAIVDCTVVTLKLFQKNHEEGYRFILSMLESDQEFQIRLGIVLLLFHYMNEEYIDRIFAIIPTISHEGYYVKMAVAWLICECFVKFKAKTKGLFQEDLDVFIHNKAISKICDSFRVSKEDKEFLKTLRKNK